MKHLFVALCLCLSVLLCCECSVSPAYRVERVVDGDTLVVVDSGGARHRLRLWAIDAPESKQSFGEASRRHLAEHVGGKLVRVEVVNTDRYGRLVAVVYVGDENENLMQVQDGYAWHYAAYAKNATDYSDAEKTARREHRGLWQDSDPVPPWDFRRR